MKKRPDKHCFSNGHTVPKRILVIRLSSIGDILLTTPALRLIKRTFPNAELDFLIKSQYAVVLANNPHIDNLLIFNSRAGRQELFSTARYIKQQQYDLVVDLHANFRSFYWRNMAGARHTVVFRKNRWRRFLLVKFGIDLYGPVRPVYKRYIDSLSVFGIKDDGQGTEFFPDPDVDAGSILSRYDVAAGQTMICVCPGAGFYTKRWPVTHFALLIKRLVHEKNAFIVVLGGRADRELGTALVKNAGAGCVDLTGKTTFPQTAGIIERAGLVISNDSGLMHLANSLKKKTLAIFGSTTKHFGFFPLPPYSRVLEVNNLKCRPCSHIGRKNCPKQHFKCMKDISPDRVYQAAVKLMQADLGKKI